MKRFIAYLLIVVAIGASVRLCFPWPTPEPCVYTVRPIEAHAIMAIALMESGDTLNMVPDGWKHYWPRPLNIPAGLSNVTFNLNIKFCVNCDDPDCDVLTVSSVLAFLPYPLDDLYYFLRR